MPENSSPKACGPQSLLLTLSSSQHELTACCGGEILEEERRNTVNSLSTSPPKKELILEERWKAYRICPSRSQIKRWTTGIWSYLGGKTVRKNASKIRDSGSFMSLPLRNLVCKDMAVNGSSLSVSSLYICNRWLLSGGYKWYPLPHPVSLLLELERVWKAMNGSTPSKNDSSLQELERESWGKEWEAVFCLSSFL